MPFETSKFGYEGGSTTADPYGVSNHFGQRQVAKGVGVTHTAGFMNELTIDLDGEMVGAAGFALMAPVIPAGSRISKVFMEVIEVFVVGGSSALIEIGTESSEATNGFSITEAQAEAVQVYDLTSALSGTWATGIMAATTVGIAMAGTSPTVTAAGKARVVIQYVKM